jgi:trk system potassium uptake protein TrkH
MARDEPTIPVDRHRGPNHQHVRRRPRQQQILELPPLRPPPRPPTSSRHAKLFAISLLCLILIGTLLLATPWTTESGQATPPVDALFTAVSAASVTGLVTFDTQDHWNFLGEAIILVLIQLGGLGFMLGASIVLQALRGGNIRLRDVMLLQLGEPSATLGEAERLARRVVRFVLTVESIGAIVLTLAFWRTMPLPEAAWHGVFHAVSAFCNAGFDLQGEFRSLVMFEQAPIVNGTIMLLIQAGSLSYIVFADLAVRRRWNLLALDSKLVISGNAALLAVGTIVFMVTEWNRTLSETPLVARPMVSLFQSVASRTAGFATVNFADVHAVILFAWVGLMFVGGASGSTAGGVKISTVMVIVSAFVSSLRGAVEPTAFGRRLPVPIIFRAMTVIALMLVTHFCATMALAAAGDAFGEFDHSFIALMFEAMSALATVGLSTGITPELDDLSKLVLCATMFVGRLGPLTAVYALQRRQQRLRYRLPKAPIHLG